jgi:hypothetical protein
VGATVVSIGLALIFLGAIAGLCFVVYLLFLAFAINRTGGTECMSDIAKAIKAYRVPLPTWRGQKSE